ncbi:MAG: hypothetical protein V4505_16210 [Pseudomonadota bacterium]
MQLPPVERSIPPPAAAESTPGVGALASEPPVRAGVTQPAKETRDYIAAQQGARGPDNPSSTSGGPNRDWTELQKKEKPEQIPPPEPIYKMLMDHIQSMWRASTAAVDIAAEAQRQAMQRSASENASKTGAIVYTDPSKVKRPPSSSAV